MKNQRIWLDLRNFDADRATVRRLVKNLKKSPEFEKATARVLFFQVSPITKAYFFEAIGRALTDLNYKSEIQYRSEAELLRGEVGSD